MDWPVSLISPLRSRPVFALLLALLAGILGGTACAQASTIEEMSIPSQALGRPLTVSIYRPADQAPKAGWPVLYLLHGLDGSNRDWSDLGGIQGTLDRLIKGGRIHPMMVVMPDAGNSWYVDSADVHGPGNYETAILNDLPKAIEKRFAPHCERRRRAIAGISMGGFGALRFAFKRPDRYVAVASLSGAIWQNVPLNLASGSVSWTGGGASYFQRVDADTIIGGVDLPPDGAHFGGAFGTPFDARRFDAANVFTLLARQVKAGAQLPAIYLTVGDNDSHDLWRGSFALYETLKADRQKVEFRVTDGDHVWSLWRRTIEDALVFVDSKFGTPDVAAPAVAALPDKPRKTAKVPGSSKVASGEAIVK